MLLRNFSIKKTQNDFSKIVRFYDFWGKLTEQKAIEEAIHISGIRNNIKMLDIGVGTGQLFERVLNLNTMGFNAGIDLSPAMLFKAKEKLSSVYYNFGLNAGNVYRLPFKDESFDYVLSSYVLDLLPEKDFDLILGEFKRVMKKGAEGLVLTMTMGSRWYNKIWYLLARYFPSLLTNCRPIDLSSYIESSGFKIIERKFVSQNTFPSDIIKFKKAYR